MRLALVFNPFEYKVHEENIRIVQKYFGLFPPLSLAWVASIAEQAGHQVRIVDARTLRLSKEETLDILKSFKPDILGFMMTTYMFQDTLGWIRFLKNRLNLPIVVGGYNLRVYPRESLSYPEIDFGVLEHAYYTIPALLKELDKDAPDFENVPGLAYKKNQEIRITAHPQKIDFDKFPNPARHLLPNELYAEFPTERRNFTAMVTSLGCPYGCVFCEAGKTPYNPRSPETVVKEMEECYYKYNIREIDIFDYEFTGLGKRVLDICQLIKSRGLDISWACRSRIDTVDGELLQEMKSAGCTRIYFGIESGNQGILDGLNKGISLQQVSNTIRICKDLDIKSLGFFLVGAPGDTKRTVQETLRFAKSLNLDYIQFSKCLAKPLTPLWKEMVKSTGKDYWKDWILGEEIDRELPRLWTKLSNEEVNTLTKWAYLSYHCRFKFILKHALALKSLLEAKRKIFAFFDMVFFQEKFSKKGKKFIAFNENQKQKIEKIKKTIQEGAPKNSLIKHSSGG